MQVCQQHMQVLQHVRAVALQHCVTLLVLRAGSWGVMLWSAVTAATWLQHRQGSCCTCLCPPLLQAWCVRVTLGHI
jgi:hypothetical protein